MSYSPNNDFLRSILLNDGVSRYMTSYYEMIQDIGLLGRGGLPRYRKNRPAERARKRLEELKRRGQLPTGDISTTGLPKGDAGCITF